tara:strand:- start:2869 stop:4716 length:1848 start_codon:yes stop_codon:yes gene_type:complete
MASQKLFIDIVARDKATRALQGLQGGLAKVRGAVFNLKNAFLGLGAGLVIRNLANTGRELENLQVRLKFLLKDTNEGAKAFDNMVKFASKVPFSLEEIQSGSGILATVTDNAKDLQNMLEITGNVAAVTGLDFRTTAEQIQRSFSAGIGAADLFREKGVRNMLGFQAGATVSIEETAKAFQRVFGKGGRFGKATDDLAQTLGGTLSMLGDKIFAFKKTLLDAGFFSQLKRQFGDLDKFLSDNSDSIERIAIGFGVTLAKAVQGLVNIFKVLKQNVDLIITAFKILLAIKIVAFMISLGKAIVPVLAGLRGIAALSGVGLGLVAASVAAVTATFLTLNEQIDKTVKGLSDAVDKSISLRNTTRELAILNRKYKETFDNSLIILREFEHELSVKIPSATQVAIDKFEELNKKSLEEIRTKIEKIKDVVAESLNDGITKVSNALGRAVVFGENLGNSLKRIAQDFMVRLVSMAIEMTIRLALEIAMQKIKDKILGDQLEKEEKKANAMKTQTTEMKKQALLSIFTGGSGSMGSFAQGGAVMKNKPILVGERGAEMFVPNSTGQITQAARGTGGGAVNVNFTINTIDSRGFDQALVENRGTITSIINSALAEKGRGELI